MSMLASWLCRPPWLRYLMDAIHWHLCQFLSMYFLNLQKVIIDFILLLLSEPRRWKDENIDTYLISLYNTLSIYNSIYILILYIVDKLWTMSVEAKVQMIRYKILWTLGVPQMGLRQIKALPMRCRWQLRAGPTLVVPWHVDPEMDPRITKRNLI